MVLYRTLVRKPTSHTSRVRSFQAADYPFPQGFFDGAALRGSCGVGAVLYLAPMHSYHLSTAAGMGTNTDAELIALWILLWFAQNSTINTLWIFEDSRCIVKWASNKTKLSSIFLIHWKRRVKSLLSAFETINICHLYREFNTTVDSLSRGSLGIMDGLLLCEEYSGTALQSSRFLKLF